MQLKQPLLVQFPHFVQNAASCTSFGSSLEPSNAVCADCTRSCLSGGKGPLAEEEERLFKLRQEKEELVQKEITKQRQMFEREAREGQLDKLCATPFGVDVVGITEFIALTGALVGGTLIIGKGTSLVLTCPINTAPSHRHQLPLPADCFLCMQGAASLA